METTITLATILLLQLTLGAEGRNIIPKDQLKPYFPPARPSVENLNALCSNGGSRPRYPERCIPPLSHAYFRRAATAVNRVEAWFSHCCQRDVAKEDQQILCCVKQAWETALSYFCTDEFSAMTIVHGCCKKKDEERLSCFDKKAPNPSYQPHAGYTAPSVPSDMNFTWDPSICLSF